jgi:hypothetical protein
MKKGMRWTGSELIATKQHNNNKTTTTTSFEKNIKEWTTEKHISRCRRES